MIWIRLDTDNAEILGADEHPAHGEWIEWGEARRIIREHNEGDSRAAESLADRVVDSIADDVQRMQVAIETLTDERDRALARVAELEVDLETTKRLLAESLVERDRLKTLHDARKVRVEGFREVLRERLGDLQ